MTKNERGAPQMQADITATSKVAQVLAQPEPDRKLQEEHARELQATIHGLE